MLVCDASAAVEVVVSGDRAEDVRHGWRTADHIIAPDLYVSEVANALWKYAREALHLATSRNHSVYDATYLVLARRFACSLATLDTRLAAHARDLGIQVIPQQG